MKFTILALPALFVALASAKTRPTVYLIRHGEKPGSGNGLSPQGEERAQCLTGVFGPSSQYNIQHIMAQTPKSDGSEQRPFDTVQPLAKELGLTVDTSCDRDDQDCVAEVVDKYHKSGSGNILICWEHDHLADIVAALGDPDQSDYPGDHFDLIWTDPYPYDNITSITSEECPGLDTGN